MMLIEESYDRAYATNLDSENNVNSLVRCLDENNCFFVVDIWRLKIVRWLERQSDHHLLVTNFSRLVDHK